MSVTIRKIATSSGRRTWCLLSVVPLPACVRVDALRTFVVPSKWLVWSRSNLFSRMKTVVSLTRFLKKAVDNSLIHRFVWSLSVKHENLSVFACSFGRRSNVRMVLGRDLVQSCTVLFSPPDVYLLRSTKGASQESILY